MNLHLRCTQEGLKKKDHIKTAFVINLPFDIEEEVRKEFEEVLDQLIMLEQLRTHKDILEKVLDMQASMSFYLQRKFFRHKQLRQKEQKQESKKQLKLQNEKNRN